MKVTKEIIYRCVQDKRDEIENELARLTVQVHYSLSDDATSKREVATLRQLAAKHHDWQLLIITYDEADSIALPDTTIAVQPVWQWLLGNGNSAR